MFGCARLRVMHGVLSYSVLSMQVEMIPSRTSRSFCRLQDGGAQQNSCNAYYFASYPLYQPTLLCLWQFTCLHIQFLRHVAAQTVPVVQDGIAAS